MVVHSGFLACGVILSVAVLQAKRRISVSTAIERQPN
jgi:hypothetical protein